MNSLKTRPGVSIETYTIPPIGTHNTIPPFTSKLNKGIEVTIHAIIINGTQPGPHVYIGGGTHGDEINGIEAVLRLSRNIDYQKLNGRLTLVPIQNPAGFEFKSRLNPYDPIDPDWVHPGSAEGSYIQRLKHHLTKLAAQADCVIDLHTAGRGGTNNPMIYVPPEIGNGAGKRSLELALAFGGDYIIYGSREDVYGWPVQNAMPFVAVREGRAGIYSEAGSGGAGVPEDRFVNYFLTGVENTLKVLGMLEGEVIEQGERHVVDPLADLDHTVRAPIRGIFNPNVQVGASVNQGQKLAEIHGIPEGVEQIKSPITGIITYIQIFGPTTIDDKLFVISSTK